MVYRDRLKQAIQDMKSKTDSFYSSEEERREQQPIHLRRFAEELVAMAMPQFESANPDLTRDQLAEARTRMLALAFQVIDEVVVIE